MRVLVKLQSIKNQPYQMEYHYPLQGFIYSLLRNSKFEQIHDKEGYKFFCFSNIFPASDLKQGDVRYLVVSSPDRDFIKHISLKLKEKKRSGKKVSIGSMEFDVKNVDILHLSLKIPLTLITGTPIIIRIPREKYEKFAVKTRYPYEYLYWRQEHPLEIFVEQLEDNLCKKYKEFTGMDTDDGCVIEKLMFKKQISTKILMKGQEQVVIGSIWEFWFNDDRHKKLLEFGIECGFGERNSLGFGFMNVKRK